MNDSGNYLVNLIEEGLGNMTSLFFYTRESLQYAVDNKVFEGKKAFANHPSKIEEAVLPERSVKDIVGHYEDVQLVDGDEGQAIIQAKFITLPGEQYDWVRTLAESAITYSGKYDTSLIGLSINASGNSQKKDIDNVIQDETLPVSVKPKLLKAKEEGATEVEYCTQLQDAISVDLVTEAGARGKIVKMIESERARMSVKNKVKEAEEKKEKKEALPPPADGKGAPPADAADPENDPAHGDADQDKELIASMLKKYVGGDDHTDEECQAMKQAYETAKEMGMEGEEAQDCAGHSMKMAKHIAQKQKEKKEATDPGASDPDKMAPGGKESDAIKKLNGRLAMLETELNKSKIKDCVAKVIKESSFDGDVATAFLDLVGGSKSEKEILEHAKSFKKGLKLASESTGFYNPEKAVAQSTGGFSLANCLKGE